MERIECDKLKRMSKVKKKRRVMTSNLNHKNNENQQICRLLCDNFLDDDLIKKLIKMKIE